MCTTLDKMLPKVREDKLSAIGETGLDFTSNIEEETQISNFKWCINVAVEVFEVIQGMMSVVAEINKQQPK